MPTYQQQRIVSKNFYKVFISHIVKLEVLDLGYCHMAIFISAKQVTLVSVRLYDCLKKNYLKSFG